MNRFKKWLLINWNIGRLLAIRKSRQKLHKEEEYVGKRLAYLNSLK